MEFLKLILGEDLYKQVEAKLNEHNGNEANKDNQVKLGNLGKGDYVHKNKYSSLEVENTSTKAQLDEANKLIETLKKGSKGNEELQGKITNYEEQVKTLQAQLAKEKLDNAIKVNLLQAKATDLDYLTYKLLAQGELKLNDKGEIEGWEDKEKALKTQYPTFFEGASTRTYNDGKLPGNEGDGTLTKAEILKKPYNERVKLFEEDPEAFRRAMEN